MLPAGVQPPSTLVRRARRRDFWFVVVALVFILGIPAGLRVVHSVHSIVSEVAGHAGGMILTVVQKGAAAIYQLAAERVVGDPGVVELVGQPISVPTSREAESVDWQATEQNVVRFSFPVHGPRGTATAHASIDCSKPEEPILIELRVVTNGTDGVEVTLVDATATPATPAPRASSGSR